MLDQRRRYRVWATLMGAAGVVVWASETALIKLAGALPPLEMVALAFVAGAITSAAIAAATGGLQPGIFRQPARVWALMVPSLAGYHGCIYFAVERAPAAPAALLQGCTPLLIVLGSAFLPGDRPRWWHWAGAASGLSGAVALIGWGSLSGVDSAGSGFALALIAAAAGLWGLYSLAARALPDVPTAAMSIFLAVSAIVTALAHFLVEPSLAPTAQQGIAIAALGALPMGLALYLWDFGVKRGDLHALSAFSYFEPFIGALLVAALGQGVLGWNALIGGALITGGAILASRNIWAETGLSPRLPAAK
jgi:drug/metabolite transporter (DMT)-like permease